MKNAEITKRRFLTVKEISTALNQHLDHVVKELFHNQPIRPIGNYLRIGNKGSLSVTLSGANAGLWNSFEEGKGGDIISLVQHALNCDFKEALNWSKRFLAINDDRKQTTHILANSKQTDKKPQFQRVIKANRIWQHSQNVKGSLAEMYLRKRGIMVTLPNCLRYQPSLSYFTNYQKRYPALICQVQDWIGKTQAIHAVYLDALTCVKITCEATAKLSYAPIKGHAVYLSRQSDHLFICEGVEDGLSLLQLYPDKSIACTLGSSGMRNIKLPKHIREVTIATDVDDAGRENSFLLRERFKDEGYQVRIIEPPVGKDFNDYLQYLNKGGENGGS